MMRRYWAASAALTLLPQLALAAAPPGAEDIRDIRAPLVIPAWWHWPLVAVVAAGTLVAAALLVRWLKRRSRASTPLEIALADLSRAQEHALHGETRQWADVVADVLRRVLADRLGAAVLPQTTSELATSSAIWEQLASNEAADAGAFRVAEAPRLLELLRTCDLARFALASLSTDALLASTGEARELVTALLVPQPVPASVSLSLRTEAAPL